MLKMTGLGLLTVFAAAGHCCYANPPTGNTKVHKIAMDREMLEFLAEFDEMDDEEFELLVSYAKKDSLKEKVESEVQEND